MIKKGVVLLLCLVLLPCLSIAQGMTLEDVVQLQAANPGKEVAWQLDIYGQTFTSKDMHIDLQDKRIRDFDTFKTFLSSFINLEKVDMFATPIRSARAFDLAEAFPDITFGWTIQIDTHFIRTDATAFSTLHSDRSTHHSSKDFAALKFCRNLVALDLGHNHISDLSFLNDLTDLRILILAKNRVTDLSLLKNLKKLEYLELFMNRIVDISPLAELTELIDIELSRNKVADFSPLNDLSKLQRLWLQGNDKDVPREALQNALPDCHIDFDSNPTQGGWRKHPRYDDIKEIFQAGIYHPWTEKPANQ